MFVFSIILAVVAVILLFISFGAPKRTAGDVPARLIIRGITVILAILVIVFLITSSFFSQDVGQSSVKRDITGNVTGQVSGSGLHPKAPWENVVTFDVRNQRVVFTNPKNSSGDNAGGQADGREIAVIDRDGVASDVDVSVRYNLNPQKVKSIYTNYKDEENLKATLIYNDIRSVVRTEAGKFRTLDLLTNRQKLANAIRTELDRRWKSEGVLIDEVALQQIDPPKSVKEAYATAQRSQIEVQKAENDLAATKVSAQQKVVQAQATADANNILTQSLSPQILQQKYIDAIANGSTFVIPEGSTPLVNTVK